MSKKSPKEFLLYGTLAEIWARETGILTKALVVQCMRSLRRLASIPTTRFVWAAARVFQRVRRSIRKVNQKDGIVVCNVGDGSIGCGPVYEAMNFSAMDQLKLLWDDKHKGGLPIIFQRL